MFDILKAARQSILTPAALALLASGVALAAPAAEASKSADPATLQDDVKRVVHLPEGVKAQLRQEIKEEVLAQAKREGWAAPNASPDWAKRFTFNGDVRSRYERVAFPQGNAVGELLDFHAINTGKPFDLNRLDFANERFLNVDHNRERPRLRARLGADVDLGKGFLAGLRLASGDSSSPVSTNQTLGGAPGNFSKYQFWLDRAFLEYEPFHGERGRLHARIGRFPNPFLATDLVWDDDINFDGIAVQSELGLAWGVKPFFTAGVFPLYTTALNFPPESPDKFASFDKWLWAAQVGVGWRISEVLDLKLGAAFYYFHRVEGRVSGPCDVHLKDVSCGTDESRPFFAQKGNTYMSLRTPSDAALEQGATSGQTFHYQFFGLASRFRELVVTGRLGFTVAPPLKVTVEGEWVRNPGFSKRQITPVALNNFGTVEAGEPFQGGDQAYLGRLVVGSPIQNESWSWAVYADYRHLESDATVDAFTDSDFGLGGTNVKGFTVGGTLAFTKNVSTGLRWMSADEIAGPKFSVDVLQIDLSARF